MLVLVSQTRIIPSSDPEMVLDPCDGTNPVKRIWLGKQPGTGRTLRHVEPTVAESKI